MLAFVLPLLIAPFAGSFLGVLIVRLPEQRPVVLARSACAACGTPLGPLDLVPLASFALQRGRCRYCGEPIGWFHPAVELAALGVSVCAVLACRTPQQVWAGCLLGWMLLALGWIDALWLLLPDALTLPLLLAGLGVAIVTAPDTVFWHALGAASGYLGLRAVAATYRLLRGREGMGAGDAKLLAAAGAWLGIGALPWVVLLAALAGLAVAGVAAIAGRPVHATTALPFGAFLAVSFWLVWLYGSAWGLP
ncbi:MAG TPA: prepilin peptidase [Acetobacteraceae bacterium]|nr:prepilin peptidase [Acetobacteraceae bacterium]